MSTDLFYLSSHRAYELSLWVPQWNSPQPQGSEPLTKAWESAPTCHTPNRLLHGHPGFSRLPCFPLKVGVGVRMILSFHRLGEVACPEAESWIQRWTVNTGLQVRQT